MSWRRLGGLLYTFRRSGDSLVQRFNLSNGRGDIVAQTSTTGALTWTASYEAYGKQTKETGTNNDRQRANSKEEDPTGLLNEGHRYRDLETGVWLSRDPAGFVDGPNLYAYVKQNPWTKFDPLGLLQRDTSGQIVMTPVGSSVMVRHPAPESWPVQPVEMKTNDGRTVIGYKNLDSSKPQCDADCHGVSVGDGKIWINNDQMKTIISGDGYVKTLKPKAGDLAVYTDAKGDVQHSVRVDSVNPKTGEVMVKGKGGVEPKIHVDPATPGPGGAWADPTAVVTYYNQPPPPAPTPPTSSAKIPVSATPTTPPPPPPTTLAPATPTKSTPPP